MYKITSCKSGYDAVYVDINKTTIRSCRKSGGLIGDLTPVPGGTTCAGDSKWTTCNGKRCCCPKDKGCDTNSLRKWCFCTMSDPDLAVDTNHGVSCPGGGRGSSCACGGMHSGIGFAGAHYCTSIR